MKRIALVAIFLMIPAFGVGKVERVYRGKTYVVDTETKILEEKYLQVLGLTLWDSSLQDAQEKIGPGPIVQDQYAPPDDSVQVCYAGINSVLLLTSPVTPRRTKRGEKQRFQEVIVSRDKHIEELYAPCTMNPQMKDLTFFNGLQLGMTREQVKKIWGPAGLETSKVMIYEIRRIQRRYFTDDISLYLEFKNGRMTLADMSRLAID